MGIMDTAKMVNEARKARKKMSQMEVVGKSGSLAVLMNGLYDVTDMEVNMDELKQELGDSFSDKQYSQIADLFTKNIKKAMEDAKKNLEKQMASMTSLDDLKNMFS